MMYGLTIHPLEDDHFFVFLIFPFRYADFVEVNHQFWFHSLDVLSQAAYHFVQEST
jgi:hypothetical protein